MITMSIGTSQAVVSVDGGQVPSQLCWIPWSYVAFVAVFTAQIWLTLCFPVSPITQACDSSQGTRQDVAQEPPFDRIRVAWYWCAAKPWMATLRYSPVSH
jgi:hypothetical protein